MFPKPTRRAVVDVGIACNLNCIHCYYRHRSAESKSYRPLSELKKEIDAAQARGCDYIDFTGGEPTGSPDIVEAVKYCSSIEMACCIITNGTVPLETIETLIDAGVNDWLISVHGTSDVHDRVVQFTGAHEKQEKFINLLIERKKTFRFNFCMIKDNQENIVETVKWMIDKNPSIINFINFNPHYEWKTNLAATREMIADLDVLEAQLSKAIPIITGAGIDEHHGIGVNIRYYPMCRLPEAFRMHICNDLQVLGDPYEWDYGFVPKDVRSYLCYAAKISLGNEWKGQPCSRCDLQHICGGINKAFYMAMNLKGGIVPVTGMFNFRSDDVYHYRRHCTKELVSPVEHNPEKILIVPVDESNWSAVPFFLSTWEQWFPDDCVVLLSNHAHHDGIRTVVDMFIGNGVYEACIEDAGPLALSCDEPEKGLLDAAYFDRLTAAAINSYPYPKIVKDIVNLREFTFSDVYNNGGETEKQFVSACQWLDPDVLQKFNIRIKSFERKAAEVNVIVVNDPVIPKQKAFQHHDGELVIFTVVDENYQWYLPLFLHSLMITNPNQKVDVCDLTISGLSNDVTEMIKPYKNCSIGSYCQYSKGGFFTAAYRFLLEPMRITDYTLITDVDILFMPENNSIVDQHMHHLRADKTECFENWVSEYRDKAPRMPGIHFVTREWWKRTEEARKNEIDVLANTESISFCHDEMMLARLVVNSGLPLPPVKAKLWRKHGRHLGDDRFDISRKIQSRYSLWEKAHVKTLMADKKFMEIAASCSIRIPVLLKIFAGWKRLFE